MTDLPRYVPDEPFPPYAYVSGQFPHPESDPAGHSYGKPKVQPQPLDPQHWHESRTYLVGFDLFNHGYYWEAHVAWESLWLAAGRRGAVADFLKALIKLAAAGVKQREGISAGVRSHANGAARLWRQLAAERESMLGLRLMDLVALTEQIEREGWPAEMVLWLDVKGTA